MPKQRGRQREASKVSHQSWNAVAPCKALQTRYCELSKGTIKGTPWCNNLCLQWDVAHHQVCCKHKGLGSQVWTIIQQETYTLTMHTQNNYARDREMRISLTRYILFFMSMPIAWKSKSQCSMTLSLLEGDYVALLEVAKEMITRKLHIVVRVDSGVPSLWLRIHCTWTFATALWTKWYWMDSSKLSLWK